MAVETSFNLKEPFRVTPTDLLRVRQRVPMVDAFVMYKVFDERPYSLRTVAVEQCGAFAVRLSLQEPFGVMHKYGRHMYEVEYTQQTEGLVLEPGEQNGLLVATTTTPNALTTDEIDIFAPMLGQYVAAVQTKLNNAAAGLPQSTAPTQAA